jgi:hypothetical protein
VYYVLCRLIAALTDGGSRASKRSFLVRISLSGPVPGSGARRRDKLLSSFLDMHYKINLNVKKSGKMVQFG